MGEKNTRPGRLAIPAVIAGNAIFGFSFLFSKLALEITLPSVLVATRFTVAFLVLNLIVLAGRLIRKDGKPLFPFSLKGKPKKDIILLALFQPVIYFAGESYGIVFTSSSFAGIIIAMIPIAGIVFDRFIMHARVDLHHILCAVGSVIGVILTTVGAVDMTSSVKGTFLLLVAVAAGALFYVFSKRSGTDYNALEQTYVMFGCGSAVYLAVALIQSGMQDWRPLADAAASPVFWIAILYLAVISSVTAFLMLNYGCAHISVSQASLFANVTTVISIIAGAVILHERITILQIAGACLILAAVTVAQIRKTGESDERSEIRDERRCN